MPSSKGTALNRHFYTLLFRHWLVTSGKLDEVLSGKIEKSVVCTEYARALSWSAGKSHTADELAKLFPPRGDDRQLAESHPIGVLTVSIQSFLAAALDHILLAED